MNELIRENVIQLEFELSMVERLRKSMLEFNDMKILQLKETHEYQRQVLEETHKMEVDTQLEQLRMEEGHQKEQHKLQREQVMDHHRMLTDQQGKQLTTEMKMDNKDFKDQQRKEWKEMMNKQKQQKNMKSAEKKQKQNDFRQWQAKQESAFLENATKTSEQRMKGLQEQQVDQISVLDVQHKTAQEHLATEHKQREQWLRSQYKKQMDQLKSKQYLELKEAILDNQTKELQLLTEQELRVKDVLKDLQSKEIFTLQGFHRQIPEPELENSHKKDKEELSTKHEQNTKVTEVFIKLKEETSERNKEQTKTLDKEVFASPAGRRETSPPEPMEKKRNSDRDSGNKEGHTNVKELTLRAAKGVDDEDYSNLITSLQTLEV